MFVLKINQTSGEIIKISMNDFEIAKNAIDPENIENGRIIAYIYDITEPTQYFYLTELEIESIEILKEDEEILFATTNLIVPIEVKSYYEGSINKIATSVHFKAKV